MNKEERKKFIMNDMNKKNAMVKYDVLSYLSLYNHWEKDGQ